MRIGYWEFYDVYKNELEVMQRMMNQQDEISMIDIRDIFNLEHQLLDEQVSYNCDDWNAHNLAYDLYERGVLH